ncbi:putative aminodeoxychorismate lyase [Moellerella wisconsensis]|nr:putative aminodeoxychorismate lyase [Moellerella wisconsensis]
MVAAATLYVLYQQVVSYGHEPITLNEDKIFTVPAGTGRIALEGLLVDGKIIEKSPAFQWLLKLQPELAQFKAGTLSATT